MSSLQINNIVSDMQYILQMILQEMDDILIYPLFEQNFKDSLVHLEIL